MKLVINVSNQNGFQFEENANLIMRTAIKSQGAPLQTSAKRWIGTYETHGMLVRGLDGS